MPRDFNFPAAAYDEYKLRSDRDDNPFDEPDEVYYSYWCRTGQHDKCGSPMCDCTTCHDEPVRDTETSNRNR
jgi:hypothetical protein